jgi:hypothetical protein
LWKKCLCAVSFYFWITFCHYKFHLHHYFFAMQLVTVNNQMNNLHDNWKIWERRCFDMGDLVVWQCLNWMKGGSVWCS